LSRDPCLQKKETSKRKKEAHPVQFTSRNSREIMVFNMIPNIPSQEVKRPII
jgi:hypothetical protein